MQLWNSVSGFGEKEQISSAMVPPRSARALATTSRGRPMVRRDAGRVARGGVVSWGVGVCGVVRRTRRDESRKRGSRTAPRFVGVLGASVHNHFIRVHIKLTMQRLVRLLSTNISHKRPPVNPCMYNFKGEVIPPAAANVIAAAGLAKFFPREAAPGALNQAQAASDMKHGHGGMRFAKRPSLHALRGSRY